MGVFKVHNLQGGVTEVDMTALEVLDNSVRGETANVIDWRLPFGSLIECFSNSRCHRLVVADRNETTQPPTIQNLRRAAWAIGADNRAATGHSFDQDIGQAFPG